MPDASDCTTTEADTDPARRALATGAIRDWASLSGVTFHGLWETFGLVLPRPEDAWTSGLVSGRFDVILFFILSGDVLSYLFYTEIS